MDVEVIVAKIRAWTSVRLADYIKVHNGRHRIVACAFLLTAFAIACALRYFSWAIAGGLESDYIAWADEFYFGGLTKAYLKGAHEILAEHTYHELVYPPGYPVFLAISQACGFELQGIRLAQAVLDASTTFAVYFVLTRIGIRWWIGCLGALVYACHPWFASGCTFLLAEALIPCMVSWLLVAMLACRSGGPRTWLACGAVASCMSLMRPDFILIIAPLLAWFWMSLPSEKRRRGVTTAALAFLLPICGWGLHNRVVHGHWLFTSNSGPYALVAGLGQFRNEFGYDCNDAKAYHELKALGIGWHSWEANQHWNALYREAWEKHPEFVIKTIATRMETILKSSEQRWFEAEPLTFQAIIARQAPVYGAWIVLLATIVAVATRNGAGSLVCALPLAYALLSLGLVYVEPRYVRYTQLSCISSIMLLSEYTFRMIEAWPAVAASRNAMAIGKAALLSAALILSLFDLNEARKEEARVFRQAAFSRLSQTMEPGAAGYLWDALLLDWRERVPGVAMRKLPDGSMSVMTSPQGSAYQLSTEFDVSDLMGFVLDVDVDVEEGAIAIALPNPNWEVFSIYKHLEKGHHRFRLPLAVQGRSSAGILIANSRNQDLSSQFTLHRLTISAVRDPRIAPSRTEARLELELRLQLAKGGSALPVLADLGSLTWSFTGKDAQISPLIGGGFDLTTDISTYGYQRLTSMNTRGARGITVHVTGEGEAGSCAIGILCNDRSRFLSTMKLPHGPFSLNGVVALKDEPGIHLVITNDLAEPGRSRVRIDRLVVNAVPGDGDLESQPWYADTLVRQARQSAGLPATQTMALVPHWSASVPDAVWMGDAEGATITATSAGRFSYQIETPVSVPGSTITGIECQLEVTSGRLAVGVLQDDGARFLATSDPLAPGNHAISLVLPRADAQRSVRLVVMNAREEDGRSSGKISAMRVITSPDASVAPTESRP